MKTALLIAVLLATLAVPIVHSDVIELKNGKTLNGKYVGGTAGTIRFETSDGVQVIETGQALALTFTGGGGTTTAAAPSAAPATAPATAHAAAPAPAPASVTVPAGTLLLVRMVDPVSSKDPQGKRFTTTLESDLAVNGVVVAKAGTKVYGKVQSAQQAGRYRGQSTLDLRLTEVSVGPNLVPIMTSGYSDAGSRSIGKAARGAAAGAAIGAIADDGEGAGKGAAIGAVASGVRKGESVSVSPGALLEFKLQQPVAVKVAK
jgi:hypothetical protein